MNKKILIIFFIFVSLPSYSLGLNINLKSQTGITECLFSKQIDNNLIFWNDIDNFSNYITSGGTLSGDIIFTQEISFETGITYLNKNLSYLCANNNEFGNGSVYINYSEFQIPLILNYSIPIKKTTEVISRIVLGAGFNVSANFGSQSYKDNITTHVGKFISPNFNLEAVVQSYYSHKIGPGRVFAGISCSMGLIQSNYKINNKLVNFGNTFFVTPIIGYTFIIYEDKGLSKITEKNKRIKDIDVN